MSPITALRRWQVSLVAVAMVIVSGCDAAQGLWQSVTGPDYEVLDSEVGTSRREIFWLDNERVIFSGIREPKPANQAEKHTTQVEILIWDVVEDTITSYRKINRGRFCYADGRIYYDVREEERPGMVNPVQIYMAGPMGEETLHEFPMDRALNNRYHFNWYTCRFVERPASVPADEGWEMLHPEHGYLHFKKPLDQEPIRYYPERGAAPVLLPFTSREISSSSLVWSRVRGAYFLYNPPTSNRQRRRWRSDDCWPIWWLYPGGETRRDCLPAGPWAQYGVDSLTPIRGGFFYSVKTSLEERSGAYIARGGDAKRLIHGLPGKPVVSLNGCRIAFPHMNDVSELRAGTPGRLTLRAITICDP